MRNGIANLMSLPQLEADGFRITYDTKTDWVIHCPDGTKLTLERDTGVCQGFPYLDMRKHKEHVAMLQTVRDNMEGFTKREVRDAILARRTQAMVGHPSDSDFAEMVSRTVLDDCPVKPPAVSNAIAIFDRDRATIPGKTVRRKSERVETEYLSIPDAFYWLHHFVTLTDDVMFINEVPFLTTQSRKIRLYTIEHVPTRTAKQLGSSVK